MKWIRHNNETTSYNYKMKLIRFHYFMKEFIALLKNEILPVCLAISEICDGKVSLESHKLMACF